MPENKPAVLEIRIPSTYNAMERVASLVEEAGKRAGISEDDGVDLMISVIEAVNNAIQHGNQEDPRKKVFVRISAGPEEFMCTIRDEGEGFDPTTISDPLKEENLLNPSGRGILMMREFMDVVAFSSQSGGTEVKMTKRFHSGDFSHA